MIIKTKQEAAFDLIKREDRLSDRHMDILERICKNPSLTIGELSNKQLVVGKKRIERNELAKRVSELKQMGIIEECGRRTCSVTGRVANMWQATGQSSIPKVVPAKATKQLSGAKPLGVTWKAVVPQDVITQDTTAEELLRKMINRRRFVLRFRAILPSAVVTRLTNSVRSLCAALSAFNYLNHLEAQSNSISWEVM